MLDIRDPAKPRIDPYKQSLVCAIDEIGTGRQIGRLERIDQGVEG